MKRIVTGCLVALFLLGVSFELCSNEVYALSRPQSYTVTFLYGAKNNSQIVNEGENAVIPTDTRIQGYTFLGWSDSANDIHSDTIILGMYSCNTPFASALNATTTVKKVNDNTSASFMPWWSDEKGVPGKTCVLRWYSSLDNKVFRTDVVAYGSSLKDPQDPYMNGYEFMGWEGSWKNVTEDRAIKACYIKLAESDLSDNNIDNIVKDDL